MKKTLIIVSAIVFFAQPTIASAKNMVGQSNHTVTVNHYDDGSMEVAGGSHDAKGKPHDENATLFLGGLLDKAKSFVSGLFGGGKKAPAPAAPAVE